MSPKGKRPPRPKVDHAAETAAWMVQNPTLAKGRILTAAKHVTAALIELVQLGGYYDGICFDGDCSDRAAHPPLKAHARYVELGMKIVQRELLHAVHALDMGPRPEEQGNDDSK